MTNQKWLASFGVQYARNDGLTSQCVMRKVKWEKHTCIPKERHGYILVFLHHSWTVQFHRCPPTHHHLTTWSAIFCINCFWCSFPRLTWYWLCWHHYHYQLMLRHLTTQKPTAILILVVLHFWTFYFRAAPSHSFVFFSRSSLSISVLFLSVSITF